ncbi:MAG: hypothetical protein R3244_03845 [Thermoanaerobaculia bacterium]|nr:hypothetical protein [Thermoanaerobaculia bacterium]
MADADLRPAEAPPLELYRAWPIWNGGLCALYRSPNRGLSGAWAVVTAHRGLPEKIRAALATGTPVLLPALGAFVFQPRNDPRLPESESLGRRREMERRLAEYLPENRRLRIRLRSYKPLYRAMTEYRFGDRVGEALYLKIQTRYAFRSLRRVYEDLVPSSEGPAQIVRPTSYLPDLQGILWAERPGRSLRSCLAKGDASALAPSARLLAALHRRAIDLERLHDRDREIETVSEWTGATAEAFPEMASALEAAASSLVGAAAELPSPRLVTAHRDFHDEQILVDRDRLELLDLDTLARAEPELDVGNFLAHLELPADGHPVARPGERFLDAYLDTGAELDGSVLAWHRASSLLRLACVYAFRPDSERRAPHLLERATIAVDRLRHRQEVTA